MPVRVLRPDAPPDPAPAGTGLRCALVNNMPDGAFVQTEQQFLRLLAAGATGRDVGVRLYTLPGVPRGERVAAHVAAAYRPAAGLWDDGIDALVVTGSEPLDASLAGEPYWDDFVALLTGAVSRRAAVLLSCLAAHGALLALDGLDRVPLPAKCSGVFDHAVAGAGPLTAGLLGPVPIPHSRYNGVPADAVVAAGWEVLLDSAVGWGAIARRRDGADMLAVQGHPEYDATSLLREWRRDLGRWVRAERPVAPHPPVTAVAPEDAGAVAALWEVARPGGPAAAAAVDAFDFDAVGARAVATWRPAGETLIANWMATIAPPGPGTGRSAQRIMG